jgi:YfiH family protein
MQIIQSKLLNKFTNLTHGFTTKDGGKSIPPYKSLNLAFHVGDKKKHVLQNHDNLAKELDYQRRTVVHMKQIHSSKVHKIGSLDDFSNPQECDALISNKTDTPLMVMVADCSPILFYDDTKRVIAVAHAGRQGTFLNIVHNVVASFVKDFNSRVEDIVVTIGASIGVCCYEVGSEINSQAKELGLEYGMQKRDNRFYLDISKILKKQLLNVGVKEANIEISKECSCCKNEKYFSYRADGVTGRFAGVIKLK